MGLKFKKIPDVVAPNFCTPIFQNTMQTTVEIIPVYSMERMKDVLTFVKVKSVLVNGRSSSTPNIPAYKVAINGEAVCIAHLLHTEYRPQTHTAASIHKSPVFN